MKTSVKIIIECENLVEDMIEYHQQQWQRWYNKSNSELTRTQREKQAYHWQAQIHKEMKEFWERVQISHGEKE